MSLALSPTTAVAASHARHTSSELARMSPFEFEFESVSELARMSPFEFEFESGSELARISPFEFEFESGTELARMSPEKPSVKHSGAWFGFGFGFGSGSSLGLGLRVRVWVRVWVRRLGEHRVGGYVVLGRGLVGHVRHGRSVDLDGRGVIRCSNRDKGQAAAIGLLQHLQLRLILLQLALGRALLLRLLLQAALHRALHPVLQPRLHPTLQALRPTLHHDLKRALHRDGLSGEGLARGRPESQDAARRWGHRLRLGRLIRVGLGGREGRGEGRGGEGGGEAGDRGPEGHLQRRGHFGRAGCEGLNELEGVGHRGRELPWEWRQRPSLSSLSCSHPEPGQTWVRLSMATLNQTCSARVRVKVRIRVRVRVKG